MEGVKVNKCKLLHSTPVLPLTYDIIIIITYYNNALASLVLIFSLGLLNSLYSSFLPPNSKIRWKEIYLNGVGWILSDTSSELDSRLYFITKEWFGLKWLSLWIGHGHAASVLCIVLLTHFRW